MNISLPGLYCFILEGLFFLKNEILWCQSEEGNFSVPEILSPLKGKEVDIFLCHKPPTPMQPDRWGGGSCYWEPSGRCPAGHHNLSSVLLRVKERGKLSYVSGKWLIKAERGKVELPIEKLDGHTGLFTACSSLNLEEAKTVDYSTLELAQIEMLSKVLETLKKV